MTESNAMSWLSNFEINSSDSDDLEIVEEYNRHEEEVKRIISESSLKRLSEQYHRILEKEDKKKEMRKEIRERFTTILFSMSNRKRVYMDKQITMRDGEIYPHRETRPAKLSYVIERRKLIENCSHIEGGSELRKLLAEMERLKLGGQYRTDYRFNEEITLEDSRVDDFNKVYYDNGEVGIKDTARFSSKVTVPMNEIGKAGHPGILLDEVSLDKAAAMVSLLPEMEEVLDTVENELDEMIERRNEVHENLKTIGAKHIVLAGL